jgi:hypothetical protein
MPTRPQTYILFVNARDESNMDEWVAHYLLLGFTYIYIFDHESVIPISTQICGLSKRVRIIQVTMKLPVKIKLMNRAISIARNIRATWMMYLDADEFLVLNRENSSLCNFVAQYPGAHSISINWLMFGSNNLVAEPDGLVINNYTTSDIALNKHVKTIVRTDKVIRVTSPHYYVIGDSSKMINSDGTVMNPDITFNFHQPTTSYADSAAFIAHYHYQCTEVYNKRKKRVHDDGSNPYARKCNHLRFNDNVNYIVRDKYGASIVTFLKSVRMSKIKLVPDSSKLV